MTTNKISATNERTKEEATSSLVRGLIQVTNFDAEISPFGLAIVVNA